MMCEVMVYNMPEKLCGEYIVATLVDGKLWFYGAYKSMEKAEMVRMECQDYRVILGGVEDV